MYLGEPLDTAALSLGKPQTVVYRQLPGYQWHLSSGLVITVVTGQGGGIKLVDETAAPADQPLGLATEDSREFGFTLNQSTHADLGLDAPSTACKGNFGADCWEYHYDNGLIMRTDFSATGNSTGGTLREVTLANESFMQQLHFNP
jgi:hypothetical protein